MPLGPFVPDYEGVIRSDRKGLLIRLNISMQKVPVRHRAFVFGSCDTDTKTLSARMRRDIAHFVYDKLEWSSASS